MHEEFIYYLWKYRLLEGKFSTNSGEEINVISTGTINNDSGPDFFNAMIEIGTTRWAGNIEIHVRSSDWFIHKHHKDDNYDNIILHVVNIADVAINRKNGELIPTLEIQGKYNLHILSKYQMFIKSRNSIPCGQLISAIKKIEVYGWFDKLMVERLEDRSNEIMTKIDNSKGDLIEIFYQRIAKGFGYTTNANSMEILAMSTPLKLLLKHIDNKFQIEALLFGQSGLLEDKFQDNYAKELLKEYRFLKTKYNLTPMNKKVWKFMRMRPVSFPTIRISQFANFLYESSGSLTNLFNLNKVQSVTNLLSVQASDYWNNHYRFDKPTPKRVKRIGTSTIDVLMINSIIPLIFVFGRIKSNPGQEDKAMSWLSQIKPELNTITREFSKYGLSPQSALESQAMKQLKDYYCSKKRCLNCNFGYILLNSD